jgi:hypothetical protein
MKSEREMIDEAIAILVDGLERARFDGHDMPKWHARKALEALGVPCPKQPGGWDGKV